MTSPLVNYEPDAGWLYLALVTAGRPLAVDSLLRSGLWREERLWELVAEARTAGLVILDEEAGASLRWADPARQAEILATNGRADVAALLGHLPFPEIVLEGARAAAREGDRARARQLYDAVAAAPDHALFPGGEATWVAALAESARLFRTTWGLPLATLDHAIAVSHARGELAAEAALLTARGLQSVWNDPEHSHAFHARAVEVAEAHGDPRLLTETRTHLALSLVIGGRIREGISAAERALGDVPEDLLDAPAAALAEQDGPAPASPIAVLAWAHATAGDHPRALDILYRMAARGSDLGSHPLENQARLFLGLVYTVVGQPAAARPHAEAAQAYWCRPGREVAYAWLAALSLAAVRGAEGRFQEAWELLDAALPAWRAAERISIDSSLSYVLLESLERAGLPGLEGYGVESEIERQLLADNLQIAGIAHRIHARRLVAQRGTAGRQQASELLERAVQLLREAGGLRELHLALSDAADLADWMAREEESARLRREAAEVARRMPAARVGASSGVLRLAPALLDLGRLGTLAPQREGLWGEVAARVCRDFGAERCAIVQAGAELTLLAARGALTWRGALLERLRAAPPTAPSFEPALSDPARAGAGAGADSAGQLVLVPFTDEAFGRRGFVALENRYTPAVVGPGDETLVAALGRQVGILLANVGMWQELLEARQRLEQENRYYRETAPETRPDLPRIVGSSPAMRQVLDLVARVAPTTTPVLVTGETGAGKELVARRIHDLSRRREGPFIAVHIAALAPGLAASALFGHERGAFTGATEQRKGRFELADGGTIFLDEIGELSLEDQVRLLRVLQEGTFERVGGTRAIRSDFRLVAVSNRDLAAEVRAGRFRSDLYFRLAAFPIRVPPLRERREEIPDLALHFMERANRKLGVRFERIEEADLARLAAHAWPGNVRELEHLVERSALLCEPPCLLIPPLDLGAMAQSPRPPAPEPAGEAPWVTFEELKRRYVRKVLQHVGGRVNGPGGAADLLGVKPSTLQYWLDKLGLREDLARARSTRGS